MAYYIAQNYSFPSWWKLWVWLWLLYFVWGSWLSFYWWFHASYAMPVFSTISWFLHPLFDWNCIDDKCVFPIYFVFLIFTHTQRHFVFLCLSCSTVATSATLTSLRVFLNAQFPVCYEGEVEYWMYEPIDLTEQSATHAATGSTMQGAWRILLYY